MVLRRRVTVCMFAVDGFGLIPYPKKTSWLAAVKPIYFIHPMGTQLVSKVRAQGFKPVNCILPEWKAVI